MPTKESHSPGMMVGREHDPPRHAWKRGSRSDPRRSSRTLKGLMVEVPNLTITVVVIAKADTAHEAALQPPVLGPAPAVDRRGVRVASGRSKLPTDPHPNLQGRDPVRRRPLIPFPDEIVNLINTCWDSKGEKSNPCSNARVGLGLALLLETGRLRNKLSTRHFGHSFATSRRSCWPWRGAISRIASLPLLLAIFHSWCLRFSAYFSQRPVTRKETT